MQENKLNYAYIVTYYICFIYFIVYAINIQRYVNET